MAIFFPRLVCYRKLCTSCRQKGKVVNFDNAKVESWRKWGVQSMCTASPVCRFPTQFFSSFSSFCMCFPFFFERKRRKEKKEKKERGGKERKEGGGGGGKRRKICHRARWGSSSLTFSKLLSETTGRKTSERFLEGSDLPEARKKDLLQKPSATHATQRWCEQAKMHQKPKRQKTLESPKNVCQGISNQ